MNVHRFESDIGIEVYASRAPGIGGKIRTVPEDFNVEEMLIDGSRAKVHFDASNPSEWGRYLLCVLIKRNWDTLIAIKNIAEYLSINQDRIHIAGIKDAKALTAQHITLSGVPPEKVSAIEIRDMTVKPLRFVDEKLSPHLLFGNGFQIKIRALAHDKATIKERIDKIRDELEDVGGLPNFFGNQRFGTTRSITHTVGGYFVRRDFEGAALAFLSKTSEFEFPDSREARQCLSETRDFKDALNYFPERLFYERLMLKHLAKYPRDFLGAFHRLPLKLRKLFVQAYQSFLFNKSLSERIKQGIPLNEPQIGDYVIELDELGLPTQRYCRTTMDNLQRTERKIDDGKAGISIPLIGFKQSPSEGTQRRIEELLLEKENISPNDFRVSKMPEVSSPGGLRLVLTPMLNFSSREPESDPLKPGELTIELDFALRRSSYATVLLREFMKPGNPVEAGF